MCLGWLLFGCDRVQIPELWGNSDFISLFLHLDISRLKNEKSLENQGFFVAISFLSPFDGKSHRKRYQGRN